MAGERASRRQLLRALPAGVGFGLGVCVCELVFGKAWAAYAEVGAQLGLASFAWVLGSGAVVVLALGLVLDVGALGERLVGRRLTWVAALAVAALVGLIAWGILGPGLFDGPKARALPMVWALPWLLGIAGGIGLLALRPLLARWPRGMGVVLVGIAVVAFVADARILAGIYVESFHPLACLVTALLGGLGALGLARAPRWPVAVGLVALIAGALAFGGRIVGDPAARTVMNKSTVQAWRSLEFFPAPGWKPVVGQDGGEDPTERAFALTAEAHRSAVAARSRVSRPSILMITADALRFDRGPGGERGAEVAPELERWGKEGVRFERTFAPTVKTYPSCRSIFSGRYPDTFLGGKLLPEPPVLPGILKDLGYTTLFMSGLVILEPRDLRWIPQLEGVFDEMAQTATAVEMIARVRALAADSAAAPWFAWLHPMEVHYPYQPPPGFARGESQPELYDGAFRYLDSLLGPFLESLPEDVWVIFTADHAEEMRDEHGFTGHGASIYQSAIHVPLVIRGPGVAPRVITEPVSLVDLFSTVLGIAGVEDPPQSDGLSLLPALDGAVDHLRTRDAIFVERRFGNVLEELSNPMRALISRDLKLLITERPASQEAFDLAKDPGEKDNLFLTDPDRGRALLGLMERRFKSRMKRWASGDRATVLEAQLGADADAGELAKLARSGDPAVRVQALRALALNPHPEEAALFREFLDDSDPEARAWAAVALGRAAPTAPWPVDLALRGADVEAREAALDILWEHPRIEAAPALIDLVDPESPGLHWRPVVILNALGHVTGVRFLEGMLAAPDPFLPGLQQVIYHLGRRPRPEVPAILERHAAKIAAGADTAANAVHVAALFPSMQMLRLLDQISDTWQRPFGGGVMVQAVARQRGRILAVIEEQRTALRANPAAASGAFRPFFVAWELEAGVNLVTAAPEILEDGAWGEPNAVVPARPLRRPRAGLRLETPPGQPGRLVISLFAAVEGTLRLILDGGAASEHHLAPGWGTVVLDLPASESAARELVFEVVGLPPEHFGVREVIVLEAP